MLPPPPPADPAGMPRPLPTPAPASTAPIPLPGVPAPAAPPPDPVIDASADAPLPGLAALSAEERAALPPLKLSMHVWSAEPARRFAIVDGQRVTEGALLGNGTVVEIRRDGVVVALGDRRVLLPRP
jgi:general secretion pathway protein B